ncbi:hypothetical protein CDAR_586581 [Caerostris darwini]|uniref:Uncharacterized protein n=1 Tax=Caerostris darwini TaxID=1538125 RepID=A0AAV4Q7E5_9ARAC|nr:hypothetical protein CDAR_586581 [Caerostris darwini]
MVVILSRERRRRSPLKKNPINPFSYNPPVVRNQHFHATVPSQLLAAKTIKSSGRNKGRLKLITGGGLITRSEDPLDQNRLHIDPHTAWGKQAARKNSTLLGCGRQLVGVGSIPQDGT